MTPLTFGTEQDQTQDIVIQVASFDGTVMLDDPKESIPGSNLIVTLVSEDGVQDRSTSTDSNALSKSSFIRVRTRCALS